MTTDATVDRVALRRRAEALAEARDWSGAIEAFEQLRDANPADADVLLQLSYMHSLAGRYRTARGYALKAHTLQPREPAVVKELIARLRTFNEGEALLACAARLGPLRNVAIPQLLAFAAQLSYLNLPERAIAFLDEAKRADPDYPPTLLSRAQVLIYLGRFADAQADLDRCLKRAPGLPKLYWLMATLGRTPRDGRLAQAIVDSLQRPGHAAEDTAMLGFALHAELDRAGRHGQAWQALELGCRAKRATLHYAPADTEALVSALIDAHPGRVAADERRGSDRVPVFIVGMHRSGTTLLEQLLSGHSEVQGIGELYDFTSAMRDATDHHCRGVIDGTLVERARGADFDQVGERYLRGVAWRLGSERLFTDKLPSNFFNIGYIARALPHARILHMVRDPVETCFSNLRELFSDANPYSYDLAELAHFHGQYRRLMAHWHRALPGRILDVDYARLTREPEATMREVSAFCGLPFESAMLDTAASSRGVATASAVQVRQGIQVRDVPKWAPYAAQLQPLIRALS
jgi:tetratricopeptide (TPR) repeat protein